MFPCPCCGYEIFRDPLGSYEVCPICFWEDDLVQLAFPDMKGGANKCSLLEAQGNFISLGACEKHLKRHVRAPRESELRNPQWRPLDGASDYYLKWDSPADREYWQTVKDAIPCLYYWLPEYHLPVR